MASPILVVVGSSPIAAEVARLGVAYTARVFGVRESGRPDLDEPWVEGVEWHTPEEGEGVIPAAVPAGAVVWADHGRDHRADAGSPRFSERFVVLTHEPVASQESGVIVAQSPPIADVGVAEFDELHDLDDPSEIPLERLAMALLRAALDEGIPNFLGPDELQHLGDAVMLQ